eukprot:Tamp_07959.p1 GENE.Tamp_07959~~Tamp_07959.p1  ORF type:complete len:703 (+),score=111.81 Tamp_07959:45-2153(+)
MSSDTARGDAPAGSGNAEVRCPWNRGGDPPRKCGGWEGNTPTVICEACDSLRTTWLTRLLSEEHVGFTRRQLLGILNRHKSYTACRQIIRIMHQQRLLDNEISDEEAAAILARDSAAAVQHHAVPPSAAASASRPATAQAEQLAGPPLISRAAGHASHEHSSPSHRCAAGATESTAAGSAPGALRAPSPPVASRALSGGGGLELTGPENVLSEKEPHGSSSSRVSSRSSSATPHSTPPVRPGTAPAVVPSLSASASSSSSSRVSASGSPAKAPASPIMKVPTKSEFSLMEEIDREAELEAAFALRRALKQEQRKEEARLRKEEAKRDLAAQKIAACKARVTSPVPPEFVVLARTFEPISCRDIVEDSHVLWDENEKVVCQKCGKTSTCARANVVPMVIGEKDHLYRATPLVKYGAVVCIPTLHCQSRPGCCIGFSKTMIALWWDKAWVPMEDFLTVAGAGDSLREVPRELCKDRVILHVLHWFSKTKEAREDDHAGLPPCGVDREAAIVYRKDHAAGYCTFSSELAATDEGWRLPTFYNIFVRQSYRKFGCARQMVTFFFRPYSVGKARHRHIMMTKPGGGAADTERVEVEVPSTLDLALDFLDMLQIDPPVSSALTTCISKILTPAERNNIVCDTGKYESGSMIFVIDPCDPKTRVFKPNSGGNTIMPCEKGKEVVFGGVCKAADVPTPTVKYSAPAKSEW